MGRAVNISPEAPSTTDSLSATHPVTSGIGKWATFTARHSRLSRALPSATPMWITHAGPDCSASHLATSADFSLAAAADTSTMSSPQALTPPASSSACRLRSHLQIAELGLSTTLPKGPKPVM
eukprot:CAMPEP_0115131900 /NCGR_PEP_ID=MMETSP0227-20121206/53410_1 /TAXON_ID=89957 /ORGANISM="Polarella glacialis, Strain CCMP 1383" /LENGTH=122 /DNA_ID=CAMNT_0002537545 /DNA_START=167 /DNA_END=535 /DNA_ORIENTATION=-